MSRRTPHVPSWTPPERRLLGRLRTPQLIQAWLDDTPYSTEPIYRCPRTVMRDRRAHCVDGAVLAAAALAEQGYPPLLLDLRALRDDDHVLAVYRTDGCWGAVAKSNFVGLRARQPVHRTLRELVLSYFEVYYNMDGERSLRAFSSPVNLDRLGQRGWRTEDGCMRRIAGCLDRAPHTPLLTRSQWRRLPKADLMTYRANMLGVELKGVYWPGGKRRIWSGS